MRLLRFSKPDSEPIINSNKLVCRSFHGVSVEQDLQQLKLLCDELRFAHEESKFSLNRAKIVSELQSVKIPDFLNKAKLVRFRLEALVEQSSNIELMKKATDELMNKLVQIMHRFCTLRDDMESDERETLQRRYYIVTGEYPEEKVLDSLMKTVNGETFLKKVIQNQGRRHIMDTIAEMQERHDTVKEIHDELIDLRDVNLQLAEFVKSQGKQMVNIEMNVKETSSEVREGDHQLRMSESRKDYKRNKWLCLGC